MMGRFPRRSGRYLARGSVASLATLMLVAGGFAPAAFADTDSTTVGGLVINHQTTPLGMDANDVRFSWQLESAARGLIQEAYQIEVVDEAGHLVWDSGRQESGESNAIGYGGPELQSQTRYTWRVKVWDSHNPSGQWSDESWFETGILHPDEWQAEWIGGTDPDTRLEEWTDYTVEVDYTLESGTAFGVFLRASGISDAYMWQLNDETDGTPMFRPHSRVGGGYDLVKEVDLTEHGLEADVLEERGTLKITVEGDSIDTSVNGTHVDTLTNSDHATGVVGFRTSESTTATESVIIHSITVTTDSGVLVDTQFDGENLFTGGELVDEGLKLEGSHEVLYSLPEPAPLLRKDFNTSGEVAQARIYSSARGVYSLELNGQGVSGDKLAPGWTDYDTRIQYQTYDVTNLLADGENTLGATLAPGWYSGTLAHIGDKNYGDRTSLITQLRIDYTDGSSEFIATDDSWVTSDGPWQYADIINGAVYDAREEQTGWSSPDFDDSQWQPVWVAPSATDKLTPQVDPPVRETQEMPALERTEPNPGEWIYDVGQNMVGVAKFTLNGKAGQTVQIRYGEEINPDGTLYTENLRKAKATDYYTFAEDGSVEFEPEFTFHGFRYIEITGVDTPPEVDEVTGLVWNSDLGFVGSLATSSSMLNQLQSNIQWGQRGNFLSIPTDTPARDERMGWSGDINVFAPTAAFNMDSMNFLSKWLIDLQDAQESNGNYWGVAPYHPNLGCCNGGTGWSDAGITVPWTLWQSYGDTSHIRSGYESMTQFMDFLAETYPDGIRDAGPYGDWLNLDDQVPSNVLGTAYYAYVARLMSEMADAIGETADAEHYADLSEAITDTFVGNYIADDGTISGHSQTGYAIALGMGLVPEEFRDNVVNKFVDTIADRDYHLATGFLGTPWLVPALADNGRVDLAYRLLLNETYPSWGYEVSMGATTMWERWNSILPDGSFGDVGMNSFNHYAYGAIGDWMYKNIGGISIGAPGYKHSIIAPRPGGDLTHASGSFDSAYGTISTNWETDDGDFHLEVTIPGNTTASVVLPTHVPTAITEGGKELKDAEGLTLGEVAEESVAVEVGSGTYSFTIHEERVAASELLDALSALDETIDELADDGDIDPATADHFHDLTEEMIEDAAHAATTAGEEALAYLASVQDTLAEGDTQVDQLKGAAHATLESAAFGVRKAAAETVATHLKLAVAPSLNSPLVLPGSVLDVAVKVKNRADQALGDAVITARSNNGWDLVSDPQQVGDVEDETDAHVGLQVPKETDAGEKQTVLGLVDFTYSGHRLQAGGTTGVVVDSPISMGEIAVDPSPAAADEVITLTVPATNDGDIPVSVVAEADSPFEDDTNITTPSVVINPGETVDLPLLFAIPITVTEYRYEVPVRLTSGDVVFDQGEATVEVELDSVQTDHVDFDHGDSRSDHDVEREEGEWYEAHIAIPHDESFTVRVVESYDVPGAQEYRVLADGEEVYERIHEYTNENSGTAEYQFDVDAIEPGEDGTIRLRFETLENGESGPVLADVWAYSTDLLDHVDLGNPHSEETHNITASEGSATEPREAGLTRRYSGIHNPGSWYEFDLDITEGEPFLLMARETYDGRQHKQFSVIINDKEVQFRDLERREDSEGTRLYQTLVDDPELLDANSVRVRMQKSDTGSEHHDPSHSDVWTLRPAQDTTAPTVHAVVTALASAHNGWHQYGPVEVMLYAADNRPGEVLIEYSTDGQEWHTYDDALNFEDDGELQLRFRATDVAGNSSSEEQLDIRIDSTPPELVYKVSKGRDVSVTAVDETSGVERIEYRFGDDENWQLYDDPISVPESVIEVQLRAFDNAGNVSTVEFVEVSPAQDGGTDAGDGDGSGAGGQDPDDGEDSGDGGAPDSGDSGEGTDPGADSDEPLTETGAAVGTAALVGVILLAAGATVMHLRRQRT